ncbi:putative methyltransferases-like [Heracleum sosnowskyi]|uniref:Methyltransferases-like n=1 Tax=Heracleum sosnowskyi TaxID=360622 RepID=A0AAD8LV08_9APIA|nr:putative methyltransferases-like [Heracleum sosnowskyi]
MDHHKPNRVRNILAKLFLFSLIFIVLRFAYVVTIHGETCDSTDFCFFSSPDSNNPNNLITTTKVGPTSTSSIIINPINIKSSPSKPSHQNPTVKFHSSIFQDLIVNGYLSPSSKSLCVDSLSDDDVIALKHIGVENSFNVFKKSNKPLVTSFKDNTFDFIFAGAGVLDNTAAPAGFSGEVARTLKPEGYFVVHTFSKDEYSFNSFIGLFNCCKFIQSREIELIDSRKIVREIVMKKEVEFIRQRVDLPVGEYDNKECLVPGYKQELIKKAESLILEEPLKPWITLKRNIENIKYLSSMVDINFKNRYVYVDVGARSYGSSVVSWFKKQYPKQNKTFDIYAIEADKTFYDQYKSKKGVTLLPYAAWVRNESLFFEINEDPGGGKKDAVKGRGMGRIKPVQSSGNDVSDVDKIQGFDFANWLKSTVTEKDFVVMKMDVEGTEFDLIPRLFETGAICLIDEIFLECHYNRWQKCCPGERSPKYEKTYEQCLDLFTSLRQRGVLVHQWW